MVMIHIFSGEQVSLRARNVVEILLFVPSESDGLLSREAKFRMKCWNRLT